jgi:hypothetical protein
MTISRIGRASEITADGPLQKVPGNATLERTLGQMTAVANVASPTLAVNATATGTFVVPFDAEIIGGLMRTITQQTTAAGSVDINKNGSSIGTVAVETADVAGTLTPVTIASDGSITPANAALVAGDVLTFSRPNTGAAGVVALTLVLVPRA